MALRPPILNDVRQGVRESRMRALAPLRYLVIAHPDKVRFDVVYPIIFGITAWAIYNIVSPRPALFGDAGLLKYTRDLLVMAVPFFIGALGAVAMGTPGAHMDRRPAGAELYLDDRALTLRQFVCYLLGYLCFLGIVTLGLSVAADLFRGPVMAWTQTHPRLRITFFLTGSLVLSMLLAALVTTLLWALYFLTDIVNRTARTDVKG